MRPQSSDSEAPRPVLLHEGTELPQKSWPIRQLKTMKPMKDSVLRGFIDRKSLNVTQKCETEKFLLGRPESRHLWVR